MITEKEQKLIDKWIKELADAGCTYDDMINIFRLAQKKWDAHQKAKKNTPTSWAVTGTHHGSIIDAPTEGEARRIFHHYYNGETITHVAKRSIPAWCD